jgi:hypothetical protein
MNMPGRFNVAYNRSQEKNKTKERHFMQLYNAIF